MGKETPEGEIIWVDLGSSLGKKKQNRDDEDDEDVDAGETAIKQVFKKAKLNEFDGIKKTGEDLEAWIEELEDFFFLREFSKEAKAKIALLQLHSVAKPWWKSYMQSRTKESAVAWKEFCAQAKKRYYSPHFNMENKMEIYGFKQHEVGKTMLTIDEYKERFFCLHIFAPKVIGDALKMKFIEVLTEFLKFQVKGVGCTDLLDVVAKAKSYKKWKTFNKNNTRMIPMGHH